MPLFPTQGTFDSGMMHGRGRLLFADGILYEGELRDNTVEGEGKMIWKDGRWVCGPSACFTHTAF
jgi:hypothetical protein